MMRTISSEEYSQFKCESKQYRELFGPDKKVFEYVLPRHKIFSSRKSSTDLGLRNLRHVRRSQAPSQAATPLSTFTNLPVGFLTLTVPRLRLARCSTPTAPSTPALSRVKTSSGGQSVASRQTSHERKASRPSLFVSPAPKTYIPTAFSDMGSLRPAPFPADPSTLAEMAAGLVAAGEYDKAIDVLRVAYGRHRTVLSVAGNYALAVHFAGLGLASQKREDEQKGNDGYEILTRLALLYPENQLLLYNKAVIECQTRRFDVCLQTIAKLSRLASDRSTFSKEEVARMKAISLLHSGSYSKAMSAYSVSTTPNQGTRACLTSPAKANEPTTFGEMVTETMHDQRPASQTQSLRTRGQTSKAGKRHTLLAPEIKDSGDLRGAIIRRNRDLFLKRIRVVMPPFSARGSVSGQKRRSTSTERLPSGREANTPTAIRQIKPTGEEKPQDPETVLKETQKFVWRLRNCSPIALKRMEDSLREAKKLLFLRGKPRYVA